MEIKTFRAKTMPQALDLVRQELGPDATVLHTRERNGSLLRRILVGRHYEIAATPALRGAIVEKPVDRSTMQDSLLAPSEEPVVAEPWPVDYGARYRSQLQSSANDQIAELQSLVTQLRAKTDRRPQAELPASLFDLFTDMIENDVDESVARKFIEQLRDENAVDLHDPLAARARLVQLLEQEIGTTGPIQLTPGQVRVAALVGPTGVGKTTTIAKLAANFRLRDNKRVGLITVDTYRIAAVEQLRTYAEIIDLPMEVVSTPREMREAIGRMRDFDLILMDTAGRSPRDDVKIHELRTILSEANPDEVHLVLSAPSSARSMANAAEQFAAAGVTALLVTKLDEATGPGNLLSLARSCQLPFSYLTDGQNVPDDIRVAERQRLSRLILGIRQVKERP